MSDDHKSLLRIMRERLFWTDEQWPSVRDDMRAFASFVRKHPTKLPAAVWLFITLDGKP